MNHRLEICRLCNSLLYDVITGKIDWAIRQLEISRLTLFMRPLPLAMRDVLSLLPPMEARATNAAKSSSADLRLHGIVIYRKIEAVVD